jgi:D-arabinose 1-dehydrogenase-like Zn-dependent alcohol dehydrogenase
MNRLDRKIELIRMSSSPQRPLLCAGITTYNALRNTRVRFVTIP